MITAVLDARCGLSVGANDIYLNVAGGLRIVEPAADLAVAAALVSALTETPVPADTVVFGEIALSGEVRPVGHAEARLKEAAKLGFAEAWMPRDAAIRPPGGESPSGLSDCRDRPFERAGGAAVAAAPPAAAGGTPRAGSRSRHDSHEPARSRVIAIIVLSAIFAFARGFVREALSIIAWVGAAVITLYGFSTV